VGKKYSRFINSFFHGTLPQFVLDLLCRLLPSDWGDNSSAFVFIANQAKEFLQQLCKTNAQRPALPAAGENKDQKRETPKLGTNSKNAQSPSRPVHALLGCFYLIK
jgi:hypothetical protein